MADYDTTNGGTPAENTPQQAPPQGYAPTGPQPFPGKNMAIAGLVLGIVSCVLWWVIPYITIFTAIVGLVLSIKARKQFKSGISMAGLVLSIIGLVGSIIWLILLIAGLALLANSASTLGTMTY